MCCLVVAGRFPHGVMLDGVWSNNGMMISSEKLKILRKIFSSATSSSMNII
jgi:hypothetical protein